jgi:hypothetical protein
VLRVFSQIASRRAGALARRLYPFAQHRLEAAAITILQSGPRQTGHLVLHHIIAAEKFVLSCWQNSDFAAVRPRFEMTWLTGSVTSVLSTTRRRQPVSAPARIT